MVKIVKKLRWVAIVIIPFLLSSITLTQAMVTKHEVAPYATRRSVRITETAGNSSNTQNPGNSSPSQLSNSADLEEKIHQALELLEQKNPDQGKVDQLLREIKVIDGRIQEEFRNTETILKSKGYGDQITARHEEFVRQYLENLQALVSGLEALKDQGFNLFGLIETKKTTDAAGLGTKIREKWLRKEFNPFKNGFPRKRAKFRPGEPSLSPSITPAYQYTPNSQLTSGAASGIQSISTSGNLQSLDTLSATPADLQETIEVRITPEIKQLARELDNNPVKIYEYVRNNIDYAPYYGSMKGAQETLWQKAGNDFDQASLLITLLRASGIPARYIYGVAQIPVNQVKNWIGINDEQTALNTFATNGIPSITLMIGAKPAYLEKEHVWVEAYLPVNNYRGSSINNSGKGWVPMDPSFKQYLETPGLNISNEVPFDAPSFFQALGSGITFGDDGASVANVNQNLATQHYDDYQEKVKQYLNQHYPQATPEDILGSRKIIPEKFSILPLSLPYQVLAVKSELAALNDNYRHMVRFSVTDPNDFLDESQMVYRTSIPNIGSQRISLSYAAATKHDAELLVSYLPKPHADGTPIKPEEMPKKLPGYLIQVVPQLMVDGKIVATGNPVTMGTEEDFYMDFSYPTRIGDPMEHIQNKVVAGSFYVITLDTGKVTNNRINQNVAALEKTKTLMDNAPTPESFSAEAIMGNFLHTIGLAYFMQIDIFNKITEKQCNVRALRMTSEAITYIGMNVSGYFGLPMNVSASGMGIDIDRDLSSIQSIDGNPANEKEYTIISGYTGSYMEGGIFEQFYKTAAVSTVHILLAANQQGIKIYKINQTNAAKLLPKLQYSADKKQTLLNLINSGKEITIPEKGVNINGWIGTGYMAIDPRDGTGAYMIDGGTAGGWLSVVETILWVILAICIITLIVCLIVMFWPVIVAFLSAAWAAIVGFFNTACIWAYVYGWALIEYIFTANTVIALALRTVIGKLVKDAIANNMDLPYWGKAILDVLYALFVAGSFKGWPPFY